MQRTHLALAAAILTLGALAPVAGAATNNIFTIAGTTEGDSGDNAPATQAQLDLVWGVAETPDGAYLISDSSANKVRRVSSAGIITTSASGLNDPRGIAATPDGGYLVANFNGDRVLRVSPTGVVTTAAGGGTGGDNGPATQAEVDGPHDVAVTADGGFLIAEINTNKIRRVSPGGTITTVAGNGTLGSDGDGGPATAAELNGPAGITPTADGGFLIAEFFGDRVRRVSPSGTITRVAGTGTDGSAGEGGPAIAAQVSDPFDVVSTPDGGYLIADGGNRRIARVSPAGRFTRVAGNGSGSDGFSGDGGPATAAAMSIPRGVAVTSEGGFMFTDSGNFKVRFVDADLRPGPQGPQGTPGPQGVPGPAGTPGSPFDRLAVAIGSDSFSARRRRRLAVRYASTVAANVTLQVLRGRRRQAQARGRARRGRNRLAVRMPRRPGRYTLRLTARGGGQVATDTARVRVR